MKGANGIKKLGNSLRYYKTAFIEKNNISNVKTKNEIE
jgi:hypothetical protein